jgi:hypothetical protein
MSFVPENRLEEALMRADKNPMSKREFHRMLLGSDVIVIGRIEGRGPSPAGTPLMPGEKLQIASKQNEGRRFIPVFSSMTRLSTYLQGKTEGYVMLAGRALLEMTRGATLLLNIGDDSGREISADEIAGLLDSNPIKPTLN